MKITIITLYNELNYGAFLQAYALGKKLENMGHTITFYCPTKHSLMDAVHMLHLRETQFIKYRINLIWNYLSDLRKFFRTSSTLPTASLTIIGSDEVWNAENTNFHHSDVYVGKGIQSGKVATYAISAGSCSMQSFERLYGKDALSNLDFVSVRDHHTMTIAERLTDKTVTECLDPTYIFDFSSMAKKVSLNDYILVYGYTFYESEICRVCELSKQTGAKIVAIGFPHEWADINLSVGPMEFIDYVNGANCVVTATFHGTAFSILLKKQFAVFDHGLNKIKDILIKTGLDSRVVTDDELKPIMDSRIDYCMVDEKLKPMRKQSEQYLCNLVKCSQ